jgi:hypothetical protein
VSARQCAAREVKGHGPKKGRFLHFFIGIKQLIVITIETESISLVVSSGILYNPLW